MTSDQLPEPARSITRRAARELVDSGAEAVVVVGSYARDEASPNSDLDLLAIGAESYLPRLSFCENLVVSVSMQPFKMHRDSFGQPEMVCTAVPGWRDARVLHDPEGIAASLIHEAQNWSWRPHERRCDRWVAESIAGYAEEVFKLVAALKKGRYSTAAAQRSLLAVHLAPVLAVHHRLLYGSENRLWDLISGAMGEGWRREQHAALGLGNETFEESCVAVLKLYALAANKVAQLFTERQRAVVAHARALAS